MRPRDRGEAGETLVEVVISVVLIGLVVAAFFSAIVTTSTASSSQRGFATADAVLRDYAEAAKQSVRDTCLPSNTGSPFTVTLPVNEPPPGFSVSGTNLKCPAPTSVNEVDITAKLPGGQIKSLAIMVRTP